MSQVRPSRSPRPKGRNQRDQTTGASPTKFSQAQTGTLLNDTLKLPKCAYGGASINRIMD